jgi:putative ABC transport system substrate-binding protein
MRKKLVALALSPLLFALSPPVDAQQATKIPRIGILSNTTSASAASIIESFKQGLRELEYVEGKNVLFEYQYANGRLERLPVLAGELLRLNVDVILASGTGESAQRRE